MKNTSFAQKTFAAYLAVLTVAVLYALTETRIALFALALTGLRGVAGSALFYALVPGVDVLLGIALGVLAGCGRWQRGIAILFPAVIHYFCTTYFVGSGMLPAFGAASVFFFTAVAFFLTAGLRSAYSA